MMNRSINSRESLVGRRSVSGEPQHRRGRSLTGVSKYTDEKLNLSVKNRRNRTFASSNESEVAMKTGMASVGSAKVADSGGDDLLLSTGGGKNDYDWLLSPPGTPLLSSSNGTKSQLNSAHPRSISSAPSPPTAKSSRVSISQTESNHPSRPSRSSSMNKPSILSTQNKPYSSTRSYSLLNTSFASVSSSIRPSSPSRHSAPSSTSRPSTPSKPSQASSTPSTRKPRASNSPRLSAPNSRPPIQSNPCTSRRNSAPSVSTASRSISSGPKARPSQPSVLPGTSEDRARPHSVGRPRQVKGNTECMDRPSSISRRQPSPVVSKGSVHSSELTTRKPVKAYESAGFGRTISKKSLDVAIKHMDIRNSAGSCSHPRPGKSLYPQSIRSPIPKARDDNGGERGLVCSEPGSSENGANCVDQGEEDGGGCGAKVGEGDVFESSRYENLLLKEDLRNTDWLQGVDDRSDHGALFDSNGLEPLPEPFGF